MDISKSVGICLNDKEMKKGDLAVALGTSPQTVSILVKSKYCSQPMVEKLAKIFEMKVSEFIALGE